MLDSGLCVCVCVPLVAVGELHVHAVSADEGPAVHGRVDAGRVWDGFAHEDGAGERRLLEPAQRARRAAVVHLQLAGAVQHLQGAAESSAETNTIEEKRKKQIMKIFFKN